MGSVGSGGGPGRARWRGRVFPPRPPWAWRGRDGGGLGRGGAQAQVLQEGEGELRQLWETEEQERLRGARHWVATLAAKGTLRERLDTKSATDILWLLMAPDNYYRLVHRRGWTKSRYRRWLAACITHSLLPVGRRPL